jgi:hypothetical protein
MPSSGTRWFSDFIVLFLYFIYSLGGNLTSSHFLPYCYSWSCTVSYTSAEGDGECLYLVPVDRTPAETLGVGGGVVSFRRKSSHPTPMELSQYAMHSFPRGEQHFLTPETARQAS